MNRATIESRIREFFISNHDDVAAVYLFGSLARGDQRPASDIDVGVLLLQQPPPTLSGLRVDLKAELGKALAADVDLVIMNTAPVDLIHRILRDGHLIFERSASARIRFEVKARNDYFDLYPFLMRYRTPRRHAQ